MSLPVVLVAVDTGCPSVLSFSQENVTISDGVCRKDLNEVT